MLLREAGSGRREALKSRKPKIGTDFSGWLAFLLILSASKSLGYGHWAWGSIERFLGGNLQMHFVFAFILSLLAHLASSGFWHRGWLLLLLMIGCALDEGLQSIFPLRSFNPLDFLVTCAGLLLAALPFVVLQWRVPKQV